jgi:hypothetical protein
MEHGERRVAGGVAAQEVMGELLRLHDMVGPRSRPARLLGLSPLTEATRPWYRGALGELAVGEVLAELGPDWRVLHAVPVGQRGSDIDHVVVGPGGVFTLNTKNHSGQDVWVAGRTFMVAGQRAPHIRNSEHEASRAAKLLSAAVGRPVPVRPVLVVVSPRKLTVREEPREVAVVTAARLLRWLHKRDEVLTPAEVEDVAAAATRPETWRAKPGPLADAAQVRAAFDGLEREERRAGRVRAAWGLGAAAALVIAGATGLVQRVLSMLLP